MEKKAEAYAKYNKAAVAEMMIKVLPDIAGKIAEPLSQIDKITIIGVPLSVADTMLHLLFAAQRTSLPPPASLPPPQALSGSGY